MLAFALLAAPGAAAAPVDVSVATGTGAGEPEVEVSPRDPNTIVVGENDTGVAVSHDRGRTFKADLAAQPRRPRADRRARRGVLLLGARRGRADVGRRRRPLGDGGQLGGQGRVAVRRGP